VEEAEGLGDYHWRRRLRGPKADPAYHTQGGSTEHHHIRHTAAEEDVNSRMVVEEAAADSRSRLVGVDIRRSFEVVDEAEGHIRHCSLGLDIRT